MILLEKKIRLLFLISDLDIGGTEKMLLELVKGLDRSIYDIAVCSIKPFGEIGEELRKLLGIKTLSLNTNHKYDFRAFVKFALLLCRLKPHIIHSQLFYDNLLATTIGRLAGVPIIIASQRYLATSDRIWRRFLSKRFLKWADVITANSMAAKNSLIYTTGVPSEAIKVIYSGKRHEELKAKTSSKMQRKMLGIPEGNFVVGIVARLHPEKGHRYFLKSAELILRKVPNTTFLVAGDGVMLPYLTDLTKKLGIVEKVKFIGNIDKVAEILQTFDVSVLTSAFESLPGAIIESMMLGKPVVATAVGGVPEIIEHGKTGLLAEVKNPYDIADKIITLLQNKKLRDKIGKDAKASVQKKFIYQRMLEKYHSLYISLLQKKNFWKTKS